MYIYARKWASYVFLKKNDVVPDNDSGLSELLGESVLKEVNAKVRDVITSPAAAASPPTSSSKSTGKCRKK